MMNQSAQPEARSAMSSQAATQTDNRLPGRSDAASQAISNAWTVAMTHIATLKEHTALIRPTTALFAAPPVLCALALLFAQGTPIQWIVAICLLLASFLAFASFSALSFRHRRDAPATEAEEWSPLRPLASTPSVTQQEQTVAYEAYASRVGFALLALAVVAALPVALRGATPTALVIVLGVVTISLYAVDDVRQRIAPLDEILTPLCLGPGLVALTVTAHGQRMNTQEWLAACAIGALALVVIEARRLSAPDDVAERAHRSLLALLGRRGVVTLMGAAALVSYALALVISVSWHGLPGALLTLIAAPLTLAGLSGLAISSYPPARRAATHQLFRAYGWFGLALAVGITLTVIAQQFTGALIHMFGG